MRIVSAAVALILTMVVSGASAQLAGTWTLEAADDLHPDGSRTPGYGAKPQGLLIIDSEGRYSLQIFRSAPAPFASGDKRKGTPEEYAAAVLGMSSHFGTFEVDAAGRTLTFRIERASYPNWNGTVQRRPYELVGDVLSYRVPPTPDGTVPISVWRRLP